MQQESLERREALLQELAELKEAEARIETELAEMKVTLEITIPEDDYRMLEQGWREFVEERKWEDGESAPSLKEYLAGGIHSLADAHR